ncbi:hypothetical protein JRQ81_001082 [Phrynocephalus forsythii]|uniref:Proline-rich membrane anchor 1 n=1 Tax=Phrynocephalus forsythii TaxID=171643 RepID=A0A9Q0Y7M0_9SAUR|nr:hypothetical protein JRQ81_001082 [Phrynocephalus forsythii]
MLIREVLLLLQCCWPSLLLQWTLHPLWGFIQITHGEPQKSCSKPVAEKVTDSCQQICQCRPPPLPPPPPPPPPPRLLGVPSPPPPSCLPGETWWPGPVIIIAACCTTPVLLFLVFIICYKAIKRPRGTVHTLRKPDLQQLRVPWQVYNKQGEIGFPEKAEVTSSGTRKEARAVVSRKNRSGEGGERKHSGINEAVEHNRARSSEDSTSSPAASWREGLLVQFSASDATRQEANALEQKEEIFRKVDRASLSDLLGHSHASKI